MVASVPLYSDAILQRMLIRQLNERQLDTNRYSGSIEIRFSSLSVNKGYEKQALLSFEQNIANMAEELALPVLERVSVYSTTQQRAVNLNERPISIDNRLLRLRYMSDLSSHIELISGRMYSDSLNDGVIEVIVNERTLIEQDMLIDEVVELPNLKHSDGSGVRIKVVGTYKNSSENDLYWYYPPQEFSDVCIMSESLFGELFLADLPEDFHLSNSWYLILDYTQMQSGDVERIGRVSAEYKDIFDRYGVNACRINYLTTVQAFPQEMLRLNITLWVLQAPIFVLLAFFIFMVSKQIMEQERNSIAVLKSRGASRAQIIRIFLGQSAIISLVSAIAGIPLGFLICKLLGASNGFLGLVQRSALDVRFNTETLLYTLCAAVLSVLTMVIPAVGFSRVTIVDHKRTQTRKKRPAWSVFFADILLLGFSLYILYNYNAQKDIISPASIDPLLYLASSMFMIGAGLFFLRIFPYALKLVFSLGKKYWSPSLYASFLKVTRSAGEEQFIMLFLVLTIATGIFNAKAARTINMNIEENVRYRYGADIVVMEDWKTNAGDETATMAVYFEPDAEKYKQLPPSVHYTKVQDTSRLSVSSIKNVRLMGINTKEFGEIAWFRNDLLPTHWYNYLNAMASDPRAVLASIDFRDIHGYNLGDSISVRNSNGMYFTGIICGFVDFWPTHTQTTTGTARDGSLVTVNNSLIVANLSQVQAMWGVMPYELWMKTDAPLEIYAFAESNNLKFSAFADSAATITASKNEPVMQGTNGVLTVGFIIVLVVCMTGFLIYWILSIRSRELQFGIFRAMGMSMGGVIKMLVCEQVLISVISIAVGTAIGYITSELYVPLIQLGYSAEANSLPLKVASESGDYGRLFAIVGIMFAACMTALSAIISKIRIAQALKLGED
jgi:putative ABC transport system permease protein